MSRDRNYNIDSGTSRERLQDEQAGKLLNVPTIWDSNDFFTVAARVLSLAIGSSIASALTQWAIQTSIGFGVWAGCLYFVLAGGAIVWAVWRYPSLFHRVGFSGAIVVGFVFGLSLHGVIR
jgi:hypothetical protein